MRCVSGGVNRPALEEQAHDRHAQHHQPDRGGHGQEGEQRSARPQRLAQPLDVARGGAAREAGGGDGADRHPEHRRSAGRGCGTRTAARRPRRARGTRRSCSRRCSPAPRPGPPWPGAMSRPIARMPGSPGRPLGPEAPALAATAAGTWMRNCAAPPSSVPTAQPSATWRGAEAHRPQHRRPDDRDHVEQRRAPAAGDAEALLRRSACPWPPRRRRRGAGTAASRA